MRSSRSPLSLSFVLAAFTLVGLVGCDDGGHLATGGNPEPLYAEGAFADPSDEIFAAGHLPRFDLEIPPAGLAALRKAPREEVPARFSYRGVTLADVGVRLKGEYSFRPIDGKPSFRIRFDEFVEDQRFLGLSRLVLNNSVQDPSYASERLAYAVARAAGIPAPRASSALVYVNGQFYGVYTSVEATDKLFLRRWFGSDRGNLYEEGGHDFVPGAEGHFELETNEKRNDRRDLAGLIAAVARSTPERFVEEVGAHLDLPQFVRYVAYEAVVGQVDGYAFRTGGPNNFRVYTDPASGLVRFIPSGMDRAMRPPKAPALVHSWVPPVPSYIKPAADAHGILVRKCLAAPACRAQLRAALDEMANVFTSLDLRAEARRIQGELGAAIRMDVRKPHDDAYFDYTHETLAAWIDGRVAALRKSMP